MYNTIYSNLCQRGKLLKEDYKNKTYKEDLHKHHIIPKHAGGSEDDENFTYLTVREHIIAHFLLWKIHKSPNDLRAMYMLGANLTSMQRKITGIYCRDNKLGFHGFTEEQRSEIGLKSYKIQLTQENSFGWFSGTPEGRKKRASIAGSASFKSKNNQKFRYWASKEGRKARATMGGKSHIGKVWIFKNDVTTRVEKDKLENYLSEGWELGHGTNKGMQNNLGKIYIQHDKLHKSKLVNESELNSYLDNGWSIGRYKENYPLKGKIKVNNGVNNKLIHPSELEEYIADGWFKGGIRKRSKKVFDT